MLLYVIFAVTLGTTTAFPVNQDAASREGFWSIHDENTNLAIDKKDTTKNFDGMWKSHVVSSYSPDSLNPMAAELRYKLSQESDRLRARLRQELLDLRQRLSPYPSHPQGTVLNVQELLSPFTKGLQMALESNTHQLCSHLRMTIQGVQADGPLLYQEAIEKIRQAMDESHKRRTAGFEDFKTKAFEAVEEDKDSSRKDLWEEVTASLGQEILSYSLEVQGKIAALKVSLTTLLSSSEPLGAEMVSKVDQFCDGSSRQNHKFIANLVQQISMIEEKQNKGEPPSHVNIESIQEDFSTRLNALLQDIVHTIN
ncbi:apolipoprotein A-IV [Tachysurus fulvidraco]|uniref:apolipoprotein A-IV n=1 Tax=Tachysurus fulvidraco TaxID=1234273 RepID=UPI001FEF9FB2|nr:apolipoprotein A-IV [Tachysurus fulvidraco]